MLRLGATGIEEEEEEVTAREIERNGGRYRYYCAKILYA
jgi:hypothetical protein